MLLLSITTIFHGCCYTEGGRYYANINYYLEYDYIADTTNCKIIASFGLAYEKDFFKKDDEWITNAELKYNDAPLDYDTTTSRYYETQSEFIFNEGEEYQFKFKTSSHGTYKIFSETFEVKPTGGPRVDSLVGGSTIRIDYTPTDYVGHSCVLSAYFYDHDRNLIWTSISDSDDFEPGYIELEIPRINNAEFIKLELECNKYRHGSNSFDYNEHFNYRYFAEYDYLPE